jgi:hypothetical protein
VGFAQPSSFRPACRLIVASGNRSPRHRSVGSRTRNNDKARNVARAAFPLTTGRHPALIGGRRDSLGVPGGVVRARVGWSSWQVAIPRTVWRRIHSGALRSPIARASRLCRAGWMGTGGRSADVTWRDAHALFQAPALGLSGAEPRRVRSCLYGPSPIHRSGEI